MQIFQFVNNISLDKHGGGAEMFALRLANELASDVESHVISVWQFGSEKEASIVESLKSQVTFHFLLEAQPRKKIKLRILLENISKILTEYEPAVINSHSALPDVINVLIKLFGNKKRRIIRTMHTDKNWIKNRFLEGILLNLVFPLAFSTEVAISGATKHRLDSRWISRLYKKESVIIPNGINNTVILNRYPPLNQPVVRQKITLVTVGRLTEQKGYTFLIQALKIIKQEHPDLARNIHLNVIGDGPLKETLHLLATQLEVSDIIRFWGYREDALKLVASSDLFISSSLWEGIPTVVLEAMALNVPIIASDIPGTREIIRNQHEGILVPPKDPRRLADAIIEILSDPHKAQLFTTNATIMVKKYGMENVKEQYLSIYKK